MFELTVFLRDRLVGRSTFSEDEVRIGRSADNEVQIENLAISRYHASIECLGEVHVLKDFSTPSGTFVNGERVVGRAPLGDGDRIGVAKYVLLFRTDKKPRGSEKAEVRDEAAFAIAGQTMVGSANIVDATKERTCPFVGYLELLQQDPAVEPLIFPLIRDANFVGSHASCEILVAGDTSCPQRAAAIVRGWQGFILIACGSGVTMNNMHVEAKAVLGNGDLLGFGNTRYRFRVGRPDAGP